MPVPLPLTLLRAAVLSPLKRPRPDAAPPSTRLTLTTTPDPDHLAAYEEICGFEAGDALPLTYPHVLAFPLAMRLMAARDFPLPLLGLVHTSIEITQYHPLPRPTSGSEQLQLTVHTETLAPHHRGTEATLTTEATLHGELLWHSRSTYLARHKTSTPKPNAPTHTHTPQQPTPTPTPTAPGIDWPLPADLGRRYAAISGDRNPIHLHPLTARPFGFPRPIAHGMWTIARCAAEHGSKDRSEGAAYLKAEFKAPVPLPSTVTYTAHGPSAFELHSSTGKPHLTGTLTREPSAAPPSGPPAPPTRSS
ncbi:MULTISPECIES: MaoC/PaaZ C-terminal domain-containing protein [unclassified Streptomyces]|uniref:MaoC family dehydratase n=1 Tax=unclassified Streptomyces TaxID=2593676 RepID=UPI00340BAF18